MHVFILWSTLFDAVCHTSKLHAIPIDQLMCRTRNLTTKKGRVENFPPKLSGRLISPLMLCYVLTDFSDWVQLFTATTDNTNAALYKRIGV